MNMIVRINDKYKYCHKGIRLLINITARSNVDFIAIVDKLCLVLTHSLNTCMQKMIQSQKSNDASYKYYSNSYNSNNYNNSKLVKLLALTLFMYNIKDKVSLMILRN